MKKLIFVLANLSFVGNIFAAESLPNEFDPRRVAQKVSEISINAVDTIEKAEIPVKAMEAELSTLRLLRSELEGVRFLRDDENVGPKIAGIAIAVVSVPIAAYTGALAIYASYDYLATTLGAGTRHGIRYDIGPNKFDLKHGNAYPKFIRNSHGIVTHVDTIYKGSEFSRWIGKHLPYKIITSPDNFTLSMLTSGIRIPTNILYRAVVALPSAAVAIGAGTVAVFASGNVATMVMNKDTYDLMIKTLDSTISNIEETLENHR